MTPAPSGRQFDIGHGEQHATVVEVGGGVRAYRVGDRDVLHPYDVDAMCDGAHGAPLIPWPNRLADGRYEFDGTQHQVALTEPAKANAIHGFLMWRPWQGAEHTADRVVMATRLHPLMGYPFTLDVRVAYTLDDHGLTVATTATNIGDAPCPYASGQHPYLSPGTGLIDACTLQFAAGFRVDTDDTRQLPTGDVEVAGTPYDFGAPRQLGDLAMDYAFGDLPRDEDGRAWLSLTGVDGCTARVWVDDTYPYLEVYTADTLAPQRRRAGLGVEPMTAPPNAFRSGTDLLRLEPGESVTNTWGATLT
ncbi:MAG TPA: aldose 1-epimerase family protein [Nocardioidaceae bacterium]|nr:aldose 1-epimerase family protein [Nocardioidaceae bacterium]